jgi:hypothetical protein
MTVPDASGNVSVRCCVGLSRQICEREKSEIKKEKRQRALLRRTFKTNI